MQPKLFPVLLLALCISLFGCSDFFGDDDDDDDKKNDGAAAAPNIYLYPETAMDISVKLTFIENGGFFTHTDPDYGDEGWNVQVVPDGRIDGTYDFLYYSGELQSRFQLIEGWAIEEADIFKWFEETLLQMGFNQKETDDFIEYWIVHLPSSPCYHIYPQDTELVNAHVAIDIEPVPDTLERVWFYIDAASYCEALLEPAQIIQFERKGFTVVEWGVFMPFE